MSLYCEVTVNIRIKSGNTFTDIGRGFIRVTKSEYTSSQIQSNRPTSTYLSFNDLYNRMNPYVDFDNSGWTFIEPYYHGDPTTGSYYNSMRRFCPYHAYIHASTYSDSDWICFHDGNGSGFNLLYNAINSSGTTNINFDGVSPTGSVSCTLGMNLRASNGFYRVGGLVISSDNIVILWQVDQSNTSYVGMPLLKIFNASTSASIISWLDSLVPPVHIDPYGPGGNSTVGGGGGTFDLDSDVIGLPPLPTLSFAATGFTRIYNPTLAQLNSLANYLWTDQTFLDTVINHLKQLLENPMDAVISLSLLPCSIPNGSPEAVKVMYINTGVSMAPATTQFVDVDCGTYTIEEFYGSALDYNPYTKVHCYLPYIGQVTLDTDEVMGKTLNVVYRIDIVTGMCAAMILVDQNVLYQFSGHCAINMPINSADFSGYIGAAMTAGKMVAGVVAGATGNIPLAAELIGAPAPHSSTSETSEKTTERNPKTGRQITAGTSTRTTTRNTPGASFGEMSRKAAANTVGAVMGSKLTVEHAGGFTGNSGYLAVRRPYLIIERPRMCNPEEYGKYNGRPSMIYMNLGECAGYTEVQSIQFENILATNPELAELSELLKSGVLF